MKKTIVITTFVVFLIVFIIVRASYSKQSHDSFRAGIPYLVDYIVISDNVCFYSINNEFGTFFNLGFLKEHSSITIPIQTSNLSFVKMISDTHLQFESDGSNSMFERNDFPIVYDVILNDDNTEIKVQKNNKFFSDIDVINVESSKKCLLDSLIFTTEGLRLLFSPNTENEANFYAAFTDIPSTTVDFDGKYLKISFENTNIREVYSLDNDYSNKNFINQVSISKIDNSSIVIIEVAEGINYFQLEKSLPDDKIPTMSIKFFKSN